MRDASAAIILTFALLVGCSGGSSAPVETTEQSAEAAAAAAEAEAAARAEMLAAVSSEISRVFDEYAETIRTSNWRGTLGLYTDDPRFYWVEAGQETYDSRQAIGDALSGIHRQIRSVEYSSSNLRITPLSHDHAVVSVDFEQLVELTDDRKIVLDGTMTGVLERLPEGWKFLLGHSTTFNRDQG